MIFDLLWFDIWIKDRLFGFGIFSIKQPDIHRSLFSIYWNDGELLIDLFWFHVLTAAPFYKY